MGGRTIRLNSLRSNNCLRIGAKGKAFKILSFKGTHGQNDEQSGGGRASGSMSYKKSAKISFVPDDSESSTLIESPDLTCDDEKIQGSRAIQRLFRNWLTLLRSPLPAQMVDQTLDEPSTPHIPETQKLTVPINKRAKIARAVWGYFLALDSRVTVPLVIFIPLYMGVNVIYGAEVSKELTPMWIFGPLFVALQVQSIRWVCQLYVYAFRQTIAVAKKLKTTYHDIASGRYKLDVVLPVTKLDVDTVKGYVIAWLMELNLDLMDAWPFYRKVWREMMYNRSDSA
jgi:hypothetical protein